MKCSLRWKIFIFFPLLQSDSTAIFLGRSGRNWSFSLSNLQTNNSKQLLRFWCWSCCQDMPPASVRSLPLIVAAGRLDRGLRIKMPLRWLRGGFLWSIGGSNSWPQDCEPCALPAELIPRSDCKDTKNFIYTMNFIREYCAKQLLIVTTDVLCAIPSGGWLHHYSKLGKLPARVVLSWFRLTRVYRISLI